MQNKDLEGEQLAETLLLGFAPAVAIGSLPAAQEYLASESSGTVYNFMPPSAGDCASTAL